MLPLMYLDGEFRAVRSYPTTLIERLFGATQFEIEYAGRWRRVYCTKKGVYHV
jgi:hypothetical protein